MGYGRLQRGDTVWVLSPSSAGCTVTDSPAVPERAIPVPEQLRRPHHFVARTRDAAKGQRPGADHRIDLGRRAGILRLLVARENVRRALLLLQSLVAEADRRGMEVEAVEGERYNSGAGVGIGAHGHVTLVEVHEDTDRVAMSDEDIARWEEEHRWYLGEQKPPSLKSVANGRLKIVLPKRWDEGTRSDGSWQNQWGEGPAGALDAKLGAILEALLARAAADVVRAQERAQAAEERKREELLRQEREQRQRLTRARAERLWAEVDAWRRAGDGRAYLEAVRARIPELEPDERERLEVWCEWAEDYVERTDPVAYPELIEGLNDERDRLWWPSQLTADRSLMALGVKR